MSMRIVIYGRQGDATAFAAMAQMRSIIAEMKVDASVQIVTDESQLKMIGVDNPPAVAIEGMMVSSGWVPSRTEMKRAIRQQIEMASGERSLG